MAERPLGVAVICILGFLGAILGILGGIALFGLGAIMPIPVASGVLGIVGILVLIISVISLVPLIWLWQMKKLGWTLTMILEVIGLLMSLVTFNIIGLIIPIIIVIYLWLKKDLFK